MDDRRYVDGVTQDLTQRKSDFLLKVASLYVAFIASVSATRQLWRSRPCA